jgi:signal transduction histidine kinase
LEPRLPAGVVRYRGLPYPLFLECDHEGHVLWMSEYTRATLGPSANLLGTIPRWRPSDPPPEGPIELVYSRVLDLGASVLIGARPVQPGEEPPEESEAVLLRLQGRLFLLYFRLLRAEQKLARRASRHRGPGGSRALRQIELERERLGRELHTSVGQQLSAIRLQAEVIAAQVPGDNHPVQQALDRVFTLTADALEQVRSISKRLHPPEWQRLSLAAALEQLWDLSGIPQRFEASLLIGPLSKEPQLEPKILIYRAAQEAVSNLIRHSRATRVNAALAERSGQLVFTFQDNGVGFDTERVLAAPPSVTGGIGLRSIREQSESLGGKLGITSGTDGTKLEVIVPFNPEVS